MAQSNEPSSELARARPTSGQLLRRYRQLAGLTQEELAARSWYSADYISKLERGQRQISQRALERLAEALSLGERELVALRAALAPSKNAVTTARSLSGRERELVAIRQFLARLSPPVLLLSGEPGIGKTRLLEETVELAARSGWRVIRGGCQRRVQDPYAPVTDAIGDSLAKLTPDRRATALQRAGYLGLLLPELAMVHGANVSGTDAQTLPLRQPVQERRLLFRAVAEYLESVATNHCVLLVLDDLQWAGQDAMDLLTALVTTARTTPLQLIGAYRDSEAPADSPIRGFVADLARASLLQVLELEPLTEDEASQLLAELLAGSGGGGREYLPVIVRRAGGVPLYLISYAEQLRRNDGGEPELDLPWSVAQVIDQRVAALPNNAREVLAVGAVVGRVVPWALLSQVTGRPEEEVITALEAATAARLLEEDKDDSFRFTHDVIRETVEHSLSSGRRRWLHRQIGEALEQRIDRQDGLAAEIGWHFLQGDEPERSVAWLLRAGDRAAAMFAHSDAEVQYRQVVELARTLGDIRVEAEALDKLGDTRYRAGRYAESLEMLEPAAEIYERIGDQYRYLRAVALIGEACSFAGHVEAGIERIERAARDLEGSGFREHPTASVADLYAALAFLYYHKGRWHDCVEAGQVAVSIAEATDNYRALCTAEVWRGLSLDRLDRIPEERQAFARAVDIAEQFGDPWLLCVALYHQGFAALSTGNFDEGERLMRRTLDVAEQGQPSSIGSFGRAQLSELLIARGRWDEARTEAERAQAESGFMGQRPGSVYPLCARGHVLLLQGEREAGLSFVYEALALAQRYDYALGVTRAQEILAWQALREERPQVALNRLECVLESERTGGHRWYPVIYAWAQLDLENEAGAADVLHRAYQRAVATGTRTDLPDLLLQLARLAARQRRWHDAVLHLAKGLAIAREIGLPFTEATLLFELGRTHVAMGDCQLAQRSFSESLLIFQRLGAPIEIAQVEQSLRALRGESETMSLVSDDIVAEG